MTDTKQSRSLEPVHAGEEEEAQRAGWAFWLLIFLRAMAAVSMLKGLFHWAVILGLKGPEGFDLQATPYQVATVFFAVIDLVAAVGLWLAAPWGAVVWLTALISMVAVETLFPQIYGGNIAIVAAEVILLGAYLVLALMAAREQSA
jgi:Family of unknown function (DUF6163)